MQAYFPIDEMPAQAVASISGSMLAGQWCNGHCVTLACTTAHLEQELMQLRSEMQVIRYMLSLFVTEMALTHLLC